MSRVGAAIVAIIAAVAPVAVLAVPFRTLPATLGYYLAGALGLLALLAVQHATRRALARRRGI